MKKDEEKALAALHTQIPLMPHGQTLTSNHNWDNRHPHTIKIIHKQEYALHHNDYKLEITEIHDNITAQEVLEIIDNLASKNIITSSTELLNQIYHRTRKELKQRHKVIKQARREHRKAQAQTQTSTNGNCLETVK